MHRNFALTLAALTFASSAFAAAPTDCKKLPSHDALKKVLTEARQEKNGGLDNEMWGAVVDRSGIVCAVVFTGKSVGDQWPASRAIAAEKANTANGLSLPGMALSTANVYTGSQPGGFLYGMNLTNPPNAAALAKGDASKFGTTNDPLVGQPIGGVVVFGGGLALYDAKGELLGAVGVSGDTSCADHNIAWRTRHTLNLDFVPKGPSADKDDAIIYDITLGKSASGFGHPTCVGDENKIAKNLPLVQKKK